MSTTTEEWQAYLRDLDAAIASGALTVSHNGKSVTYASEESLKARRRWVLAQLGQSGARRPRFRQFRFVGSRGRQ